MQRLCLINHHYYYQHQYYLHYQNYQQNYQYFQYLFNYQKQMNYYYYHYWYYHYYQYFINPINFNFDHYQQQYLYLNFLLLPPHLFDFIITQLQIINMSMYKMLKDLTFYHDKYHIYQNLSKFNIKNYTKIIIIK